MSVSTPSQGTHFSDGVRTGPILGSSFTPGANVLMPSVMVSSPIDQLAPGIFTTPMSLLDIIPAPTASASIAALQNPAGAGYLTLLATNNINRNIITFSGIPNVIKLDCARAVSITGVLNTTAQTFTVFGWDQYGIPLVEEITGPAGANTTLGKKAFLYIQAIHVGAATVANVSVGTSNIFGIPFYISNKNYYIPAWNNVSEGVGGTKTSGVLLPATATTGDVRGTYTTPDAADGIKRLTINFYNASGDTRNYNSASQSTRYLVTDPLQSTNGFGFIIVLAPNHQLTEGENVTIAGGAAFNNLTAQEINITAPVSIVDADHFSYETGGMANNNGMGGGSFVNLTPGLGNLYQNTVGRFGVSQFTRALI